MSSKSIEHQLISVKSIFEKIIGHSKKTISNLNEFSIFEALKIC